MLCRVTPVSLNQQLASAAAPQANIAVLANSHALHRHAPLQRESHKLPAGIYMTDIAAKTNNIFKRRASRKYLHVAMVYWIHKRKEMMHAR